MTFFSQRIKMIETIQVVLSVTANDKSDLDNSQDIRKLAEFYLTEMCSELEENEGLEVSYRMLSE